VMKKEVTGWLGFFIFTLLVASPLANLVMILRGSSSPLEVVESVASISLFLLAGIFLLSRTPYALSFTKVVLMVTLAVGVISWAMRLSPSPQSENLFGLLRAISYPIIWLLYLSRSKRVKLVYGGLKEGKEHTTIWPILGAVYGVFSPAYGIVFSTLGLRKMAKLENLRGMELCMLGLVFSIVVLAIAFTRFLS
ncbi:MAG: hypothetical protein Q7S65_01710, partial [Nanoarchaeota archaeon]|nr:hypothetical protein [Nanoarchaeota archaeon]